MHDVHTERFFKPVMINNIMAVGDGPIKTITLRGSRTTGYAAIMDILNAVLTAAGFLLFLGIAKLLSTCLTLGSGASGGVFWPCMFIGAAVGAGFGSALAGIPPGLALNPVHFAVAGMAAMVGGNDRRGHHRDCRDIRDDSKTTTG
jgi:H+/Cl- antiporter ClcA